MIKALTRKELKELKARDFKEGDTVLVFDKNDEVVYSIYISFGEYKSPLKTTVQDKSGKYLSCTPGVKNGWPYYIADFIYAT